MPIVVVVHTGPTTVQPIKVQFQELRPDVRVVNIMDDSLLSDVMTAGHLTDAISVRLLSYLQQGEAMGAVALLNACSSVGEAAAAARAGVSIPIFKIDDAMAEQAVAMGPRIGVVATVRTTLEPTVRLINAKAAAVGRQIQITEAVAEGGYQALLGGNPELHDEVVKRTILSLADTVDVIVLAQVSMARLVASITDIRVPVLSSPKSGVAAVCKALAELH